MFPGGKPPGEDFINSWYPILIALVMGVFFGIRNYLRGPKNPSGEGAKGKVCVITGGTRGIGSEIAKEMAIRGARVIIAGRDEATAKVTIEEIVRASKNKNVFYMKLDLASFKSVRRFAKKVLESEERIDFLYNNAGVMSLPYQLTGDGNETHFQVNYLGHFLLTQLFLERMKESAPARIINMLAPAYSLIEPVWFQDPNFLKDAEKYTTTQSYAGAKTSILMFTRKLAKDLEGTNVTVNCVLPGIVNTDIYNLMPFRQSWFLSVAFSPLIWMFTKCSIDGAQTPLYVGLAKEEEGVSGKIYKDLAIVPPVETCPPERLDEQWWDTSVKITRSDVTLEEDDGGESETEAVTEDGKGDSNEDAKENETNEEEKIKEKGNKSTQKKSKKRKEENDEE